MALKVNSQLELKINLPNLANIEKMLNDSSYRELIEFSATFNTRLCVERKLRMPFLDPQTGVAQRHSSLFMKKSQRIPGLRDGQIYSYPSTRWRKAKRQYLNNANSYPFNYRPFGRFRENEFDLHPPQEFVPQEEPSFRPGMTEDSHSKDSHKEDNSKSGWYYDEIDINDMDNFEEPEEDSDDDFMEPRSGRKKKGSVGRTPGSSTRRSGKDREPDNRRGRNNNRGRGRKVNPPPMDNSSNSSDKFAEYSRRRANMSQPPQVTTTHNPNPMSFDEAIPEHKIPTTERGKTHFDDDRMSGGIMSTASTSGMPGMASSLMGTPTKMSTTEKSEKPRANPSTYCDFCLGDARENKKTNQSEVS